MTIQSYLDFEIMTPYNLSVEPLKIQFCGTDYSNVSQTRPIPPGIDPIMFTGGGTQTYNYQGRPSDNDND